MLGCSSSFIFTKRLRSVPSADMGLFVRAVWGADKGRTYEYLASTVAETVAEKNRQRGYSRISMMDTTHVSKATST